MNKKKNKSIHLYIDANIYLEFYRFAKDDIEELHKLIELIKDEKIVLYLPKQTFDEVYRNRENVINGELKKFKKISDLLKVNFPAFTRYFDEYEELKDILAKASEKHKELYKKTLEVAKEWKFNADQVILELMNIVKHVKITHEIHDKALKRFQKGNPPGKKKGNTIGDEINWEALKEEVPDGEDLYLVSGDSDYESALREGKISVFLAAEWRNYKKGNVHLYNSLTDYFKNNFPDIKLAVDIEKNRLIEQLGLSQSFAETHSIVAGLLRQNSFSKIQAEELIHIAVTNSQVSMIIADEDVRYLYTRIQNENGAKLSQESKTTIDNMLSRLPSSDNDDSDD